MSNNNLKLTSVRIDPDTLKLLDEFVSKHTYWTRNAVINSILTTVMNRFGNRDIYDMVRTWEFTKEPITAIYKINELPKPTEE